RRARRRELEADVHGLLERPAMILLNKVDLLEGLEEEVERQERELAAWDLPVLTASALEGQGLDEVREALFELLPPRPAPVRAQPERRVTVAPLEVKRDMSGQGWVITGTEIEAVVARFDPTNPDAVSYLQHHFRTLGVNRSEEHTSELQS